jgi:hypothetical protein
MTNHIVVMTDETLSAKAKRYDAFRKSIPFIQKPNVLLFTRGVSDTFPDEVPMILKMVKDFKTFTERNDPWREHDFGAFEFGGERLFWKIDDYEGYDGYQLVMTVMLASEY